MQVPRVLAYIVVVMVCAAGSESRKVATVYDIFALIYRLCATEGSLRAAGLECVDYHMGAEVSRVLEQCMLHHRIKSEIDLKQNETSDVKSIPESGVNRLCDRLTIVEEWTSKNSRPPNQLTTVIGIEALGRMTCVMGSVQRTLPTWTAAFAKCFQNQDAALSSHKLRGKEPPSTANL